MKITRHYCRGFEFLPFIGWYSTPKIIAFGWGFVYWNINYKN